MLSAIIAILGGIIASSSLIVSKRPDAKEIIEKLTPFQGVIGLLILFWGIKSAIYGISHLSGFGVGTFLVLAQSVVEIVVGFLLSYGLISKYLLESNRDAKIKGQKLRARLAKYQEPFGIVLILLGLFALIF